MKERRSAHRTQWAAQFAVASELCKLNYQVALTLGNHPAVDLMVISPSGKPFLIDVKGLYRQSFWGVRKQAPREDLYYVFALVPDEATNRFYVLTQHQVNEQIIREVESSRTRAISKGRSDEKAGLFPGVSWRFVQPYENKWDVLPK